MVRRERLSGGPEQREPTCASVKTALATWEVQVADNTECWEVELRLAVLVEAVRLLMHQLPYNPDALVPPLPLSEGAE